jgi:hypothetical protein
MKTHTSLSQTSNELLPSRSRSSSDPTAEVSRIAADWDDGVASLMCARWNAEANRCSRRSKGLLKAAGPSSLTRGEFAW